MSLVIFIGSRSHFPDCLLRMVETEIDDCTTIRLITPDGLPDAIARETPPCLIVVEDSLWPQLETLSLAQQTAAGQISLAIAFRHKQMLAQSYVFCPAHLGRLSYLPMDMNIDTWLNVVRLLLTGCTLVPTELRAMGNDLLVGDRVAVPPAAGVVDSDLKKLTPREMDVLALVAQGMQNKHIAGQLQLSEHTVKLHLHHVISKLGAHNRTEVAMRYRRSELT